MTAMILSLLLPTANAFDYGTLTGGGDADMNESVPVEVPELLPFEGDNSWTEFVTGGAQAQRGAWPDAAGLVFSQSYVGCTGTLIAPNVVLTAAHCIDGAYVSHVLLDSTDWSSNQGEFYEVRDQIMHPQYGSSGYGGYDIGILVLRDNVEGIEPRKVALDCIIDDKVNRDDPVAIVGYGATNRSGNQNTSRLMEGFHYITNKNCTDPNDGCDPATSPGGEIIAGGDGVDACFGDSGGPLYWLGSEEGEEDYVIGATSRAKWGVAYPCGEGGIWTRPDYFINFIQNRSGVTIERPQCNDAPVVSAEAIDTKKNESGFTVVSVDDDGNGFDVSVAVDPANGTVTIEDDGEVVYTPDDGFTGEDSFILAVTDDGSAYEASPPITVEVEVPVSVSGSAFGGGDGAGGCACDASGSPAGFAGVLALGLFGLVRRRR